MPITFRKKISTATPAPQSGAPSESRGKRLTLRTVKCLRQFGKAIHERALRSTLRENNRECPSPQSKAAIQKLMTGQGILLQSSYPVDKREEAVQKKLC
jgi:hypothetical protein